jgi:hypothetical protein
MKTIKYHLLITLLLISYCEIFAQKTTVSITNNQFYINGKPTYQGRYWQNHKIEGLLMNSRMVQGLFDDLNPEVSPEFQYPDTQKWDATRNNNEFIAAMPQWKANGLLAFTINMQGGSPYGYGNKKCINPGFHSDGRLMKPYMNRLENILKKADELNMVVILGLFYFGQDQYLNDEKAVKNAVKNMRNWILKKGYRNVVIEIANECDHKDYDHAILRPDRISELINLIKNKKKQGVRLLASTSFTGRKVPNDQVIETSDFLLIHGNGAKNSADIQTLIDKTKVSKAYHTMPIINNEDDHYDFDNEANNMIVSIKNYVSWGYFDFRFKGETDINEGYQTIPVNWGISSNRKKAFFTKLKEITENE